MSIDLAGAVAFVATHGRLLDRHRLDVLVNGAAPSGVLAALDAYRNPDGGYGWGLEPDLRASESQPSAAMHALEVLAEVWPATTPRAAELCDWLDANSLDSGGLPFALPVADAAGCAPFWLDPEASAASLQTTAQVAANAHLVARRDRGVAEHPWLGRATGWCLSAIAGLDEAPQAHELMFAIRLLDAVAQVEPQADRLLAKLAAFVPDDGVVTVAGGSPDEALRPLDLSPWPGGAARRLFDGKVIADELRRLADQQQPDGGWTVDFASSSPAAALEWRGYMTVAAVTILRRHEVG